ncbi:hypothetical protein [Streptomyces sp. NPDC093261]
MRRLSAAAVTTAAVLLSACSVPATDQHRQVSYGVSAPQHP